ncbi:PREDICTED: LEAF RUST 10 DISEASE-RESISTANCE LOCUS RECEPTOR-LIKE PROTEIN KINASE-like 2.4 isoform X1 [Camelina sativa]|uniref:LEAF RUST 10 DISEASE-RESISTANCE LOCUS RECEPTOR-LIKE PROTEIN KINASE-like 2.4 isoform X1 n=1 Tax=Camelina sativa TaxID=90675 RepID=A0ABM0SLH5_CAMSA|nr:PREDICTED: LEAF RUST 10 DISEASE-RESISTANCE LOCUS RECEPTOR-LIKE PROTEIN KINASE-like 2.4 isoform X1 [Camelina sativa]
MTERLPLILLLALHLFVSGVFSTSIITLENKCNKTIWPVIFSWRSQVSTTGFTLKSGEARAIQAPSSWYGLISARTLCSNDSAGNFTCATGDCESGGVECPGAYSWSPVTYLLFRIDDGGINSYTISLEYGYNLPLKVVPSIPTCISSGCMVDLSKTCPNDLKKFVGRDIVACNSACREDNSQENCCTRYFNSKQTCKPTQYVENFDRACPFAYSYAFNDNNSTFTCTNSTDYVITFCPSSIPNTTRSSMAPLPAEPKHNSQGMLNTILGVAAALAVLIIIVVIVVVVRAKNAKRKNELSDENIDAVVMLKRYSFEQVKKMTNSFAHVLGKGGFGIVYKGKLPDKSGRDIALKILKESSQGNAEEFINELVSMSRASHVNIVSLFGFCYEGNNRAIIYEFMPNGSLDKFISENMSTKKDWKALYNIAVGVARGLEYLHNSCVSKIVHFDIKPQNILIDEEFCPKISDFGLAKLGKRKESIISMLDARGTVGYIAPEMFSKNYGGVSHKSDVYSYGMVVLEMIGATKREGVETSTSNKSSVYFPDWVYDDLERKETMRILEDHVIEEEDEKIVKKMTLVGLWCIQNTPYDRPPMRKVVQMLEGSLDALQVPPKAPLSLQVVTDWENAEDSQQSSTLSLLERKPPSTGQYTPGVSKEAV